MLSRVADSLYWMGRYLERAVHEDAFARMNSRDAGGYQIAGWVLFTHRSNIASNSASLSSSIAFLGGAYAGLIPASWLYSLVTSMPSKMPGGSY